MAGEPVREPARLARSKLVDAAPPMSEACWAVACPPRNATVRIPYAGNMDGMWMGCQMPVRRDGTQDIHCTGIYYTVVNICTGVRVLYKQVMAR